MNTSKLPIAQIGTILSNLFGKRKEASTTSKPVDTKAIEAKKAEAPKILEMLTALKDKEQSFTFKNNRFGDAMVLASNLAQASQPIDPVFRQEFKVQSAVAPLLDSSKAITDIQASSDLISSNLSAGSTNGIAALSSIAAKTQDAIGKTQFQYDERNQQIEAQNEAARINAINQNEANRVQATKAAYDEIQMQVANRASGINQVLNQANLLNQKRILEDNAINSALINTPYLKATKTLFGDKKVKIDVDAYTKFTLERKLEAEKKALEEAEKKTKSAVEK